ncbi:hypothetical protein [Stenotrophomonas maltophilia]|uniref:hypothetical protein n=1 Tax=Stenotrophomonas maltophilia TaxID=40324 RepID=UPI001E468FE4|nr:hypothetical protein [Stenotrophomonas maltophilia]
MADASGDMGLFVVLLFVFVVSLGVLVSVVIEHAYLSLRDLLKLFRTRKGRTK